MEVTDLVYLLLLDKFHGMTWPVKLNVGYVYDYKSVDISYADWILIYGASQSMDWFGIGAENYLVINRATIDVRTSSKERYGKLKDLIKQVFTGGIFAFKGGGVPVATLIEDTDFLQYRTVGVYVKKFELADPSAWSFERGDKIEVQYVDGSTDTVWVWGVYDDWLYVVRKSGVYCLIRPRGSDDLSDKMRKMYRFVMDVEGQLIESVGGV